MKKIQEVNNLTRVNSIDFTVTATGEAFVSQRKAAELCGTSRSSVVHLLKGKHTISQGVGDTALSFLVQHFAQKGKAEAVQTLILFAKAGAKAFIYHEAGYTVKAETKAVQDMTRIEQAEEHLRLVKIIVATEAQISSVTGQFLSTRGKLGAVTKKCNKLQLALGVSSKYIPIAVMKKRFTTFNFNGHLLVRMAKKLDEKVEQVHGIHNTAPVNQYTVKTWLRAYPLLIPLLENLK